jgi:dienelactone hydrolase
MGAWEAARLSRATAFERWRAWRSPSSVLTVALALLFLAFGARAESPVPGVIQETLRVRLAAGGSTVDVYRPDVDSPTPMVVVAHGFSRNRRHMAGWGKHLAAQGYVAVVPDLPSRSDHVRNGRFLTELRERLIGDATWQSRIDPARVGLVGFSAGGLASLLSAVEEPEPVAWIGLDPVDRGGLGARVAPGVRARVLVLTAEPSACNAQGNALGIVAALPRHEHAHVAGAVHVDAEWPTSPLAELVCGRSTEARRAEFRERASAALREAFASR